KRTDLEALPRQDVPHRGHVVARHRKLSIPFQPHLLHHPGRRRVADQGARHDAPRPRVGERPANQVPRPFGRETLASPRAAEAEADTQLASAVARLGDKTTIEGGPQVEPADEVAASALLGGEEAVTGMSRVIGDEALEDLQAVSVGAGELQWANVAH